MARRMRCSLTGRDVPRDWANRLTRMTGMISLHPALVKALTETGWSWMVDYRHDDEKDFMHFEVK